MSWLDNITAIALNSEGKAFISRDEGLTWKNIPSIQQGIRIYQSPASRDAVFIPSSSSLCYLSLDKGNTWKSFSVPIYVDYPIIWHPLQKGFALGLASNYQLYLTKDFGESWSGLRLKNVRQYSWGDAGRDQISFSRVYAIVQSFNTLDFIQTDNYGESTQIILRNCFKFLFLQYQIFGGVFVPYSTEISLHVSPDLGKANKRFFEAQFPFGDFLDEKGYAILNDDTGSVFMGVNHDNLLTGWGNLYTSDAMGVRYSLSQERISRYALYYDFESVKDLEGIHLINLVAKYETNQPSKLRTRFSFNNGGDWVALKPPHFDSNNQPIKCSGDCALQLHGISSLGADSYHAPFYSRENAIGIILSTGNVGEYLSYTDEEVNTYITSDAGVTWKELRKGSSIYEIADHGGIIVYADWKKKTNKIYYTLDQGKTSDFITLETGPIDIYNILAEPSATGRNFIVLGGENNTEYVIGLNFSNVFPRECSQSDYENWSPQDLRESLHNQSCIFGRTIVYQRKKPDAKCFNPSIFDHIVEVHNCPCTEEDYECDIGYSRKDEKCVLDGSPPKYPPSYCPKGSYYSKTKGYRLIASDTCEGGLDLRPEGKYPCNKDSSKGWIIAVVIVLFVVLLLVGVGFALKSETLREKIPFIAKLNKGVGYLGMRSAPDVDDLRLNVSGSDEENNPPKEENNSPKENNDREEPKKTTTTEMQQETNLIEIENQKPEEKEEPFDPRA